MSEPAKRIYVYPEFTHTVTEKHETDVAYVRADLVDGLVEALKTCRFSGYTDIDGDYITTQHFDGPKVRAALKEER